VAATAPLAASTRVSVPLPWFETNTSCASGVTATPVGNMPTATRLVSAPVKGLNVASKPFAGETSATAT
jgi:hypothetical protein